MSITIHQFERKIKTIEEAKKRRLPEDKLLHSNPSSMPPPAQLTIQRKAIRVFPGNKAVALYYSPKLKKYISIPYDSQEGDNLPITEETLLEAAKKKTKIAKPGVMEIFKTAAEGKQHTRFVHRSGQISKVDPHTIKAIMGVHKKLNKDNQVKLADMCHKDKLNFGKVAAFCLGAYEDDSAEHMVPSAGKQNVTNKPRKPTPGPNRPVGHRDLKAKNPLVKEDTVATGNKQITGFWGDEVKRKIKEDKPWRSK